MPWDAWAQSIPQVPPVTQVVSASPAASATPMPEVPITSAIPASTGTSSPTSLPQPAETAAPAPSATPAPAVTGTAPATSSSNGTISVTSGSNVAVAPAPAPPSPYSIEIDLAKQRAFLLRDGQTIAQAPISSGRAGHLTPQGNFEVIQKDLNHFSNLYGKIVEKRSGRVVKSGADVATPVPKGCKFEPAPMKWFLRFDGASGMHAGILPGYPASHGCVRMPASKAQLFYDTVQLGTPVHVFGATPLRATRENQNPALHHHEAVTANTVKATPSPTPKPRHGWWIF